MRKCKLLLLLLLSLLVTVGANAKLYTLTQDVKVRRGAGTKFDTYYKLTRGDTVEQMELQGKWSRIVYKEKEGYVLTKLLYELPEDNSIPEDVSLEDVDPYADLDPKTIAGLIGVICLLWAARVGMEKMRQKKDAAKAVAEAPELKKASYWFVCKACNQKQRALSTPSRAYCLKAETHDWINLGEVGDVNYHCKHCGTTVLTSKTPRERDCSTAGTHTWTNLGKIGNKHYYCKECGVTILAGAEPTNINCSHAELHTWAEL